MPKDASTFDLSLGERPAGIALHNWLCGEIRQAVQAGRLRYGQRLPASRDLASQYGISRGTVVAVYEQLQAEGYLTSRVGAGTTVSARLATRPQQHQQQRHSNPRKTPAPDTLTGSVYPQPAAPFRVHAVAVNEFPVRTWARLVGRRMRNADAALLSGGGALGFGPLRDALAAYLGNFRGVRCEAAQVAIVSSVQQSLDLLSRFLFRPGNRVVMEDPGYFGATQAFRNNGLKPIACPLDSKGLTVPSRHEHGAYLTPAHQFPLGITMPLDRRLEILAWARQHSAWLIEDDYDSEYRFEGRPIAALQGLDVAGRVVFTGSFNKLMFPALRIGFIVLPPSLVDAFRAFRFRTELQGSSLDQAVLCDFIVDGHLSRHIRHMREIYGTRLDALDRGVKRYLRGIASLSPVRAGLYTSLLLHNGLGSEQAESVAAAAGVESLGLHRFCIRCQDPKGLLLGFGGFPEPAIHAALRKLARAFESS